MSDCIICTKDEAVCPVGCSICHSYVACLTCLLEWLDGPVSRGHCPTCRGKLRKVLLGFMRHDDISSWSDVLMLRDVIGRPSSPPPLRRQNATQFQGMSPPPTQGSSASQSTSHPIITANRPRFYAQPIESFLFSDEDED